jgi:hypothetical protein
MPDSIATPRKNALPPPRRRRAWGLFALAVFPALLVSACGGNNPAGLPNVPNGIVQITVTPNPVVGSQSPLTGTVSLSFVIDVQEVNGLGGTLQSVSSAVFDPADGRQYAVNYFDSDDLKVFVGTDRIDPLGSLDITQTVNYVLPNLAVEANLVVTVQFLDDRGSLQNQSVLVQVVAPS